MSKHVKNVNALNNCLAGGVSMGWISEKEREGIQGLFASATANPPAQATAVSPQDDDDMNDMLNGVTPKSRTIQATAAPGFSQEYTTGYTVGHADGYASAERRATAAPTEKVQPVAIVTDCVTVEKKDGTGYEWGRGDFICQKELELGTELYAAPPVTTDLSAAIMALPRFGIDANGEIAELAHAPMLKRDHVLHALALASQPSAVPQTNSSSNSSSNSAAVPQAVAVPESHVLVPKVPTQDMLNNVAAFCTGTTDHDNRLIYRAMLAAIPTTPSGDA